MTYTIALSKEELSSGVLHENTLRIAKHFFSVHGFLKIENLFPKEFLQTLASSYEKELVLQEEGDALNKGTLASHRRYIVTIPIKGPFNDPMLYANPHLLQILKSLLGSQLILSSLGAISALPGSTNQHLHADYFPLFEENIPKSNEIPPFAITVAIPLLDIDPLNGPTQIWSGSHLTYPIQESMAAYQKYLLCGPIGSCYFWDYRTFHCGGSNHSEHMRSE